MSSPPQATTLTLLFVRQPYLLSLLLLQYFAHPPPSSDSAFGKEHTRGSQSLMERIMRDKDVQEIYLAGLCTLYTPPFS